MPTKTLSWIPQTLAKDQAAYLAIADAIANDIRDGRLLPNTQLPPQRQLAQEIGLNFTTISRAYGEAQRRGLLEARVGQGTFVKADACPRLRHVPQRRKLVDMSMNHPPEPGDAKLLEMMSRGIRNATADVGSLLRYYPFGGDSDDKEAAKQWLKLRGISVDIEKILVCPGTHSVINALLSMLLDRSGGGICCDNITYPGFRALAALHGVSMIGLASDHEGTLPEAFEQACRDNRPAAFYCNPSLQNPTTITLSVARREALAEVARRFGVPIIEDDPYSLLLDNPPPSFYSLLPEQTYYIGGLSKTVGAGLRVAYLALPSPRQLPRISAILRAVSVMVPPVSQAIATEWIFDGTATSLLNFVRDESRARQALVAQALQGTPYQASPEGFHIWLPLPEGWSRVSFATYLRNSGIGVVTSDAFLVSGAAVEAVRICLGGAATRDEVLSSMELVGSALSHPPAIYSAIV